MSATFEGTRTLAFPIRTVWEAMFDVDVLRASIVGCERFEQTGPGAYSSKVRITLGPVSASFATTLDVNDSQPPNSCVLRFSGQGGAVGFGRGEANVRLTAQGADQTLLEWTASTQVGGRIAQVGARLIDAAVRKLTDEFFDRFAAQLRDRYASPAASEAEPPIVAATQAAPKAGSRAISWTLAAVAACAIVALVLWLGGNR